MTASASLSSSSSSTDQLKIVLIGDSATGKHCYLKRLTHNIFTTDTRTNDECDIISAKIKIDQNTDIPIQFFNIAGSQRGKTKIKQYFKNIDGYIIMFDITRGETYDNVIGWKNFIDSVNSPDKLPCLLVANKCDLELDNVLNVAMNAMENYCQAVGFSCYYKISNMNNTNIKQSLQSLINEIMKRRIISPAKSSSMSLAHTKQEYTLKVLVIGDIGTGKTALIQRYVSNSFAGAYRSTDIAGQERFGIMTHLYYKRAAGCLIVFDVSKPTTLTNGAAKWKVDFDNKVSVDENTPVPCLLVGNKCDLLKEGIIASETQMTEFCQRNKFTRWYETSARDNINIGKVFLTLLEEMMQNIDTMKDVVKRRSSTIVDIQNMTPISNNSNRCCHI
ncbi:unnamed protein product [Rotaria socialis]|uniref:Uncharacterized protein n=1 Tax=Rotaria socialis TaxID=392032 RepID=A0A820KDS2_9BILA|nr:unnamed protein product [Rotaria socialis]CAF4422165.1 unnamed protein product [Rotaria socialis]CAF4611450.1 unnamed protein product [Rotaria socialis]CAF4688748.1 unnamed protein product [Rotaria socialis]